MNHIKTLVEADYPFLFDLFCHYNKNPELGMDTFQTAKRQAAELRDAGYEVTEGVAQTGVVGILKNGEGPTICFGQIWTLCQFKMTVGKHGLLKY